MTSFWHPALSTTLSVSKLWPQMHYVYQNPKNGEFVACNNRVMLIERNGAIPMFEFWNADGMPADVQGLEYVDYENKLKTAQNDANRLFVKDVVYKGEFTFIDEFKVLTSDWEKVWDFIGIDIIINIPSPYSHKPIYVRNADGSRQALIMPFKRCTEWNLLNDAEEVINVCDSYKQAKELGELLCGDKFIIKEKTDA